MTTGGTMGAVAYPDPQKPPRYSPMPPAPQDYVRDALKSDFPDFKTRYLPLKPIDSKDMDDAYREKLVDIIMDAPERKIIITHGTDTLLKTADFLYDKLAEFKTVIITGAMVPLSNGLTSDGYGNLSFALETLDSPPPGLGHVNVVLSDFDAHGAWTPKLYPYEPGQYEKFHDPDPRYSRLVKAS